MTASTQIRERLLGRLDAIGQSLAQREGTLMLLGLGSVGLETDRLDAYSDLDFFAIVRPEQKLRYIKQLDWLEDVCPLAYAFQNTEVGCKILFEDGIFGEYAVFTPEELASAVYPAARIVWQRQPSELATARPAAPLPQMRKQDMTHPLNEALTNLYVGLGRYARGEKLSAMRFVQGYAVDSILSVLHVLEEEQPGFPDPFGNERRAEQRFPAFAALMPRLLSGYEGTPLAALHLLAFLEDVYPINRRMAAEIRMLAHQLGASLEKHA